MLYRAYLNIGLIAYTCMTCVRWENAVLRLTCMWCEAAGMDESSSPSVRYCIDDNMKDIKKFGIRL